jgi:glycopeptide antibiotics resistance protein
LAAVRPERALFAAWLAATLAMTLAPFWPPRPHPRYFDNGSRPALDFALNVALFLPGGCLLRRIAGRASTATAAAALVSFAIEVAQKYIPLRYPSQLDLAANTLGALLGAILAWRFRRILVVT